jgi:hypothetical protein
MNRAGIYNIISPELTLFSHLWHPILYLLLHRVSLILLWMSVDALRQLVAVESLTLALSFVRIIFPTN